VRVSERNVVGSTTVGKTSPVRSEAGDAVNDAPAGAGADSGGARQDESRHVARRVAPLLGVAVALEHVKDATTDASDGELGLE
jgi:hypothetical protein